MRLADVARVFDGERLTLARHLAGLKKNGLAAKIEKTPTAVASYENGLKRPSAETVGQLALALGVEPDFFVAAGGRMHAASSAPHFRSLRSTTQVVRDQARAFGFVVAHVAETLERHVDFPELDLLRDQVSLDGEESSSPEECAAALRAYWGLGDGPAPHVVRLLERHGVVVTFSPNPVASVDAYSFDARGRSIVVLNPAKDDYYRQRFDAAHELGHLVMHADAEPGSSVAETQANRFAAEFLLPAERIRPLLPTRPGWPQLLALKEEWKVSLQSLLFRAKTLGVMDEKTYKTSMVYISNQGWRRREPGKTSNLEQPSLLPGASELLETAGRTERDLASECRVPLRLFKQATSRTPIADVVEGEAAEGSGISLVG